MRQTAAAWREIIDDINERCGGQNYNAVGAGTKLIQTLAHTVTDGAATEIKFTRIIEQYTFLSRERDSIPHCVGPLVGRWVGR